MGFSPMIEKCSLTTLLMLGLWWIGAGTRQTTGKTVAIIVGGAAALGFVVICMLFARNLMKKHEGM